MTPLYVSSITGPEHDYRRSYELRCIAIEP